MSNVPEISLLEKDLNHSYLKKLQSALPSREAHVSNIEIIHFSPGQVKPLSNMYSTFSFQKTIVSNIETIANSFFLSE